MQVDASFHTFERPAGNAGPMRSTSARRDRPLDRWIKPWLKRPDTFGGVSAVSEVGNARLRPTLPSPSRWRRIPRCQGCRPAGCSLRAELARYVGRCRRSVQARPCPDQLERWVITWPNARIRAVADRSSRLSHEEQECKNEESMGPSQAKYQPAANVEVVSWQDMLSTAPPGQKAQIIDQISRVAAQIQAIEAQMRCARRP